MKDTTILHDATNAAAWEARVRDGRAMVKPGPSAKAFNKLEKDTAQYTEQLRAKWTGINRLIFEYEFYRAKRDPTYGQQMVGQDVGDLSPPMLIGYGVMGFIALIVVWGGIRLFAGSGNVKPATQPPPPPPPTTYGSAAWAQPFCMPPSQMYNYYGVFFGKSCFPGADNDLLIQGSPVCSEPGHHVLIAAQTGAGKSTRVIIPTLLRYIENCVVIDPKGELAAVSARARATTLNQRIHIINPWGELAGTFQKLGFPPATYNPLDILDPTDPNVVANAQSLARAICPLDKAGTDNFWNKNAASILTAVFLWLADAPGETKTLGRTHEIVTSTKPELQKYLAQMAASEAFDGAIRANSAPFVGMANETFTSIMANVSQFTNWLSDPQIKKATATSSFTMQDFMSHPKLCSTIYLVIPTDQMDTQATWLRLMITAITNGYRHPKQKVHPCMFLIDEFPALGRVEIMPSSIAIMRGMGVTFTLVVQGLSDLKSVYGNDADRILNNCAYKWFCNVDDLESAQYLSKTLGNTTVPTIGTGQSVSAGLKGGSSGQSINFGQTGRPLMMPDEIMNLNRNIAILLAPQRRPQFLHTVDYWDLTRAFAWHSKGFPALYTDPPLTWDDNPLIQR
jgi:type IV secretory pathway TraG/TraD family ATPase VirD4